jgi:hypothetical protein
MVLLQRHEPGEIVSFTTQYALVGHYGEPTMVALWLNAGERLPLATASDVEPPIWYVTVGLPETPPLVELAA